jgi:ribonuclease BN (tRNA processing enzyme)
MQGYRLLLECGNGSFSRLQEVMDFRNLDGVVISHFHEDHSADLFCLKHAVTGSIVYGQRANPLDLWAPEEPVLALESLSRQPEILKLQPLGQGIIRDQFEVQVLRTAHPMLTYALRLKETATGQVLAYTGDTEWKNELVGWAKDADVLLCEASFQEEDRLRRSYGGHLTAREAGRLARAAGVKRLVLTHFFPEYDLEVSRREAEDSFGAKVELAGVDWNCRRKLNLDLVGSSS